MKRTTAAGILPISHGKTPGIFVAIEKKDQKITYTDFGGKFEYEDVYPYITATREFNEETYHLFHLSPGWYSMGHQIIYIESPNPEKLYACHVVNVTALERFMGAPTFRGIEPIDSVREKVISLYPERYYPVVGYTFIPKEELESSEFRSMLSYRLQRILKEIKW